MGFDPWIYLSVVMLSKKTISDKIIKDIEKMFGEKIKKITGGITFTLACGEYDNDKIDDVVDFSIKYPFLLIGYTREYHGYSSTSYSSKIYKKGVERPDLDIYIKNNTAKITHYIKKIRYVPEYYYYDQEKNEEFPLNRSRHIFYE